MTLLSTQARTDKFQKSFRRLSLSLESVGEDENEAFGFMSRAHSLDEEQFEACRARGVW